MPCTVRTTPVPAARAVAPWAPWLATHRDGSCPAGCSATARDGLACRARALNLTQRLQSCYFSKKKKKNCSPAAPWLAVARHCVASRPTPVTWIATVRAPVCAQAAPGQEQEALRRRVQPEQQGVRESARAGGRGPGSPRPVARCLSAPACRVRACHVNAPPRSLSVLHVDRASFEPGCGLVSGVHRVGYFVRTHARRVTGSVQIDSGFQAWAWAPGEPPCIRAQLAVAGRRLEHSCLFDWRACHW